MQTLHVSETELPLSSLEIDPENVRSEYDPGVVAGLRSSLQVEGEFINPPIVYPLGDGRYRVKHGSTRVLAAQGVVDTIRVRVTDPPASDSTKLLSQMSENLLQGSLRPADVGQALKRLRTADGKERSVSQLVGALKAVGLERTKSWVAMHLQLAELAPEVQRLVNQGAIPAEAAYQLRTLPAHDQIAWAQRVLNEGLTREQLRSQLGLTSSEPEHVHHELAERIAEVAQAVEGPAREQRSDSRDPDHRNSRPVSRWELLPVSTDRYDLQPFDSAAWAETATPQQRDLAQEALFLGGYTPDQAVDLVRQAVDEAATASDTVLAALNALRALVEHPADVLPGSALAAFVSMRAQRVLDNLAAQPACLSR